MRSLRATFGARYKNSPTNNRLLVSSSSTTTVITLTSAPTQPQEYKRLSASSTGAAFNCESFPMFPKAAPSVYQSPKCFVSYGSMGHTDPKQLPRKSKPWSNFMALDFIHKACLVDSDSTPQTAAYVFALGGSNHAQGDLRNNAPAACPGKLHTMLLQSYYDLGANFSRRVFHGLY